MDAGWYSDPNGGPHLRWWDGTAWTEHTTPPAAGAPVGSPPPAPDTSGTSPETGPPSGGFPPAGPAGPATGGFSQSGPPSGGFPPPGPATGGYPPGPPPPRNNPGRFLLIGLVALIVVLLGAGGFVLATGDDDETSPNPTTTTAEDDGTTTTTGDDGTTTPTTAEEPDSEFVSTGGLTFTRLPEPWQDWVSNGQTPIPELEGTAGQFVVVQEQAPSGGQWIGNLLIGDMTSSIPYSGEADLPTAAQALSDTLIANYYVEGAAASILRETEVTIDGHPGYFIHNEVTFQQEGLETTREKVVIVVVDTGRPRPGVFWASIPYNRIDLNEGMDEVYRTLQVND